MLQDKRIFHNKVSILQILIFFVDISNYLELFRINFLKLLIALHEFISFFQFLQIKFWFLLKNFFDVWAFCGTFKFIYLFKINWYIFFSLKVKILLLMGSKKLFIKSKMGLNIKKWELEIILIKWGFKIDTYFLFLWRLDLILQELSLAWINHLIILNRKLLFEYILRFLAQYI